MSGTVVPGAADPDLTGPEGLGFRELVFSDLRRYRPTRSPTWAGVLAQLVSNPGFVATVVLRAQQSAMAGGRGRRAALLRTLGMVLVSADLVPGASVGPGLMVPHPNGLVLGGGARLGTDVTLGAGVAFGVRRPDGGLDDDAFPTVCDGVVVLTHAVVAGPVRVGPHAMIGANSVLTSDAPARAVMVGLPARQVGERQPVIPGSAELLG